LQMNPDEKADEPMEVAEPQSGTSAGASSQPPPKPGKFRFISGAIKHYFLGDSHLRGGNHVPQLYNSRRSDGQTDPRFGKPERKTEMEDGPGCSEGYYLDEKYLEQLKSLLDERSGKATALVLSIGTNDLRATPTREALGVLLRNFQDLLDKLQTTEGVVLYIIAPIPCADERVRLLRDELQSELWRLIQRSFRLTGGRVMYVNLTRDEKPRIPKGPTGFFSDQYWKDQKHLNQEGAKLLVDELIKQQKATSSRPFLVDRETWEPISRQQQPPQQQPSAAKGGPSVKDRLGPRPTPTSQSGDQPKGNKPDGPASAPRHDTKGQKRKATGTVTERKGKGLGRGLTGPADEQGKGGKKPYQPPNPWAGFAPWGPGTVPPMYPPYGLPVLPPPGPGAGQWWIPPPTPTCRGYGSGPSGPRDDGPGGPGGWGGGSAYPPYPPPIHCHYVLCWGGCGQTHTHP